MEYGALKKGKSVQRGISAAVLLFFYDSLCYNADKHAAARRHAGNGIRGSCGLSCIDINEAYGEAVRKERLTGISGQEPDLGETASGPP